MEMVTQIMIQMESWFMVIVYLHFVDQQHPLLELLLTEEFHKTIVHVSGVHSIEADSFPCS